MKRCVLFLLFALCIPCMHGTAKKVLHDVPIKRIIELDCNSNLIDDQADIVLEKALHGHKLTHAECYELQEICYYILDHNRSRLNDDELEQLVQQIDTIITPVKAERDALDEIDIDTDDNTMLRAVNTDEVGDSGGGLTINPNGGNLTLNPSG